MNLLGSSSFRSIWTLVFVMSCRRSELLQECDTQYRCTDSYSETDTSHVLESSGSAEGSADDTASTDSGTSTVGSSTTAGSLSSTTISEGTAITTSSGSTNSSSTTGETCGDGALDIDEECDDGNWEAGDGCSAQCTIEERLVFVSSVTFAGDLTPAEPLEAPPPPDLQSLELADAYCQALAVSAGLDGSFGAWLSLGGLFPSEDASDAGYRLGLTQFDGRFMNSGGGVVAEGWTGLTSGSLESAIDLDENGSEVAGEVVWTNTDEFGAPVQDGIDGSCGNWGKYPFLFTGGFVGNTGSKNELWTNSEIHPCKQNAHLYCFQTGG